MQHQHQPKQEFDTYYNPNEFTNDNLPNNLLGIKKNKQQIPMNNLSLGLNLNNSKDFRELIDEDMTKELEEFRKNSGKAGNGGMNMMAKGSEKKNSEADISPLKKPTDEISKNNSEEKEKGVFAEAILNLSTYVKTS